MRVSVRVEYFFFLREQLKIFFFAKNKIKCGLVNFKSVLSFDTE